MPDTLEQVLADAADEVKVARRYGSVPVDVFERIVKRVKDAAEPFTTWLSEGDAVLHSGHTVAWLRARFARWEREGHARRTRHGKREYRETALPRRVDVDAVRADAARTARGEQPTADPCLP